MRFADTSYFIGLLKPHDRLHRQAVDISRGWRGRLFTTTWILVEAGNALSAPLDREIFTNFTQALVRNIAVTIVPATDDWFIRGFDLYRRRSDKAWSLTDCISFLVMREHGIGEALTADHHFTQAGFQVLLQN